MMRELLLLVVVYIIAVQQVSKAQFTEKYEGNVRLMSGDSAKDSYQGVLQVYTGDQWTIVCYQNNDSLVVTNKGAAAAACRQRGRISSANWGSAYTLGYNNTENTQPKLAIKGIRCPEVMSYWTQGEIFLLRCDHDNELIPKNECDQLVGVQCEDPDSGTAYNGQVQLYDDSDTGRHALLRVHFNGEWLPLCTSYLSNVSANSVCRQMGFTHSSQPPISSREKSRSWKINDLSNCNPANYTSLPCFTDCINRSSTSSYTLVEQCDEHQYELICRYDSSRAVVHSSGSHWTCSYPTVAASVDVPLETVGGVTGGLSLVILLLVGVIVGLLCCRQNRNDPQPRCWQRRYGAVAENNNRDDN